MFFKRLSLLLIIFSIKCSTSELIPSDISDCSEIDAPPDFFPIIWLGSKNLEDDEFIIKEKKVRRIVNETRIFTLQCSAPFPLTMWSASIVKSKDHADQVHNNLKIENYKLLRLFIARSFMIVEPKEEFHLEGSCIPTCDPSKFLYGARMHTKEDKENFSEIVIEKIFSSSPDSSLFGQHLLRTLMYFGWLFAWGVVIVSLIMFFKYVFPLQGLQGNRRWDDIEMSVFSP